MLTAKIKRLDTSLPLPRYETNKSFGVDLLTRETYTIDPQSIGLIPANIIVQCPEHYAFLILPRSSMFKKTGLMFPHSIGLIDRDYCGPEDEVKIQVYNPSGAPITIEKGTKMAQGMFVHAPQVQFEEVDEISDTSRGGFGSTG